MVAKSHFIAYFRVKICKTIRSALNSVPLLTVTPWDNFLNYCNLEISFCYGFLCERKWPTYIYKYYIYIYMYIYIYIYIYMLIVIFYDLPFSRGSFNSKKLSYFFSVLTLLTSYKYYAISSWEIWNHWFGNMIERLFVNCIEAIPYQCFLINGGKFLKKLWCCAGGRE